MDKQAILLAIPIILALGALVVSIAAWEVVRHDRDRTRLASRTEVLEVKKEVAELFGLCQDLTEQFKRLRSRVGMRELRDRDRDDAPDPGKNPEAYRSYLERKHSTTLAAFRAKKETAQ